jgi:hypothetical protein
MNSVIGFTRLELVDLMLDYGIHTSIGKFEVLVAVLQQRVIEASGAAVKIEVMSTGEKK